MSDAIETDAASRQTLDRRNLLLGTSSLVAAAALASDALAQVLKALPPPDLRQQDLQDA
ncbi:hypothetical protein [Bradyrhizobium commune]|uniref:Uncharacterized protein n=1 Tax=Bradyrhizobium commune TaxID=83627 RepID=A0A7S9D1A7_9BRAD|nr:hypothetical protein [Bradyrhizobium commune]QPF89345.1 hypothetical protein IC761_22855 [Bradyrhizobium commune]